MSASLAAKERFMRLRQLCVTGAWDDAAKGVAAALRVTPKDPNLLHLAAEIAEAQKDPARAALLYRRALTAQPGWFEAAYNLARVLDAQKDTAGAVAAITLASQQRPTFPPVWEALAQFTTRAGDIPAAIQAWQRYLTYVPLDPNAMGQLHLLMRQIADWRTAPDPTAPWSPFVTPLLFDDPALQLRAAQRYAAQKFAPIKPLPPPPPERLPGRLRLGYLSSDFHAHATAYLMAELFALHDRAAFEVFAYSYGVEDGSPIRARLQETAEHFVTLNNLKPAEAAARIRADAIDVLIDMKGYTQGSRLNIAAYRPARVQGHWLGYPGTLGAPFIDFLVADPVTIPPASAEFYTETILRLPHTYQINDRQRQVAPPQPRSAYGLPDKALVLASFNQTQKITPEMFALWCSLLVEDPRAVLWLYESNQLAPAALRRAATQQGVAPERLIFAPPVPLADHLARYHVVDLALDSYPYGGHTTTSDALWVGAPVVTLAGRSFASRVAAGLLQAANLPDLVTGSPDAYRLRALALMQNDAERLKIREFLAANRATLPLFDTPRFVKEWEETLVSYLKKRDG